MIVNLLLAEALNSPIVSIAEQRNPAVRLRICSHEVAHSRESRPGFLRRVLTVTTEKEIAGKKCLQNQTMVSGRHFEIDAIVGRLGKDLLLHNRTTERKPAARRIRPLEQTSEKHQTDTVAQVVVAVQIGLLEVLDDELAVKEQGAEKGGTKRAVAARRSFGKEMKSPDPADGS